MYVEFALTNKSVWSVFIKIFGDMEITFRDLLRVSVNLYLVYCSLDHDVRYQCH